MTKGGSIILRIYFALVALITLVIMIISVSDLINIGLRSYIFPKADQAYSYDTCGIQPRMPTEDTKNMVVEDEEYCQKMQAKEIERQAAQKQRDAVRDISLLIVSIPLFWLHFRIVYKDWKDEKKKQV
ncbi:MAG: hypothetical protein ABIH21_01860 [Patescibacteria group bacterium]